VAVIGEALCSNCFWLGIVDSIFKWGPHLVDFGVGVLPSELGAFGQVLLGD
jgi:hypothetical protein